MHSFTVINTMQEYVQWFDNVGMNDVGSVGGKNASLGEMISHLKPLGVSVPNGYATTAFAFNEFLQKNALDKRISEVLSKLNVSDIQALTKDKDKQYRN